MLISHQKKFVFLHLPKTAGSAITMALAPYCENVNFIPKEEYVKFNNGSSQRLQGWQMMMHYNNDMHHHFSKYWKIIPEDYFTFCFVRNPFVRFASYFNALKHQYKSITKLLRNRPLPTMIETIDRQPSYIGKYETIDDDWKYISNYLNINVQLPVINMASSKYDWRQLYTKQDKYNIYLHYYDDFKKFGY